MTLKLLTIDTATSACSAALTVDGSTRELFEIAEQKTSAIILPMVASLLAEAGLSLSQLDAIAFGCGPGSFTGARLAASIVQGLCFGCDLPAIPISTLQSIAQGTLRQHAEERVLVALDARMQEIYWAAYQVAENNLMQPVIKDLLCQPQEPVLPEDKTKKWSGAGNGWLVYGNIFAATCAEQHLSLNNIFPQQQSHAQDIAALAVDQYQKGKLLNASQVLPVYLQDDVYKKKL